MTKRETKPTTEKPATRKVTRGELRALSSAVLTRSALSAALGKSFGGDRDLYIELGYPGIITFEQFNAMYNRQDIAGRVVDMPPDETWRRSPTVRELVGDELGGIHLGEFSLTLVFCHTKRLG